MKKRPNLTGGHKKEIIKISKQDVIKSNSLYLNSFMIIFFILIGYFLFEIYSERKKLVHS